MKLEVRTTQWGRMTETSEFFAKLDAMRAEYRRGGDIFSEPERRRLEFTRWLIENGRMGR